MDLSVLEQPALDLLRAISRSPLGAQVYLAGGTALALQFGRRTSRDLDFFTREPLEVLPDQLRRRAARC